ncbi:23S rRNA (pseudouridine(1915)-N(3))-methyltransferase RlmH [Parvularcula lutaonensis]|uniref:Ribosomal RNA large subunit methyltransferase H n=1 Tax=Parvularcula lutaonensis TaxID=491923 RepID=A0ABV7MG12_9PROT|nr:23S rRNA (pseudouridine(1915)-N(3))-methyltransferase RlmH [Parvularcula lutaonensis]GGY55514.1 ribosomal RNA large subunit methyltransferase H [Parvularcula lutaonensis]
MRLQLLAIAREQKRDPLDEAAKEYLKRAAGAAPQLGLKGPEERFIAPAKGNDPAREAETLRQAIAGQAVLLDERGKQMSSPEIARMIAAKRDAGVPALAFCIGGADGFDPAFRDEILRAGGQALAFGRAVWPHALCRTMLAEQLYRALAILGGHPYHRGQ